MRLSRVYVPTPLMSDAEIELDEPTRHYLLNVLRLKTGRALIAFDGTGGEYSATLHCEGKKKASLIVGEFNAISRESPLQIHLQMCVSRGDHMDFALQKAVELGVTKITPIFSEYSAPPLPPDRLGKRLAHWHSVIISACQQSGRTRLPRLDDPQPIEQSLAPEPEALNVVLDPGATRPLKSLARPTGPTNLLIGAEGGLSPAEIDLAQRWGYTAVQLGPRVLRTETAAITAITAVQLLWGDLNDDSGDKAT